MATKYWLGNNSGHEGDWNTAANWSGGIPAAGDTVVFDGRAGVVDSTISNQTIGNHYSVTTTPTNVYDYAAIIIASDFTGNVGLSTAPINCGCNLLTADGTGTHYFVADTTNLDVVNVNNGIVYLDKDAAETAGIINLYAGMVYGDLNITTLNLFGGTGIITGDITTLNGYGGAVYYNGDVGTLNNVAAAIYAGQTSDSPATVSNITAMTMSGGTFRWLLGGTISALTLNGGTFTVEGSGAKTLGNNATIAVNAGTLNLASGLNIVALGGTSTVSVSNAATFYPPKTTGINW